MRRWQRLGPVWWVAPAYTGLTVVMTWPMALRPSLPYATVQGDFGYWLWTIWWMKKALIDLWTFPYFTSYLYFPTGTSLIFYNLSPYNGLAGIPLQILGAGVITTYNLLYLSSFVIGGVGVFFLVRELEGNPYASFFAGVAYVFSPFHTMVYQWTNLWTTQWLPYALWFAVRLIQGCRRSDGVGLAVCLALATLSDWHQPVFLTVVIIILALSSVLDRRPPGVVHPGALRRLFQSFLLYGLLVSPLAYVALREMAAGGTILHTGSWFRGFELLGLRAWPGSDVISYGVLQGWIPIALAAYGITKGLDFWTRRYAGLLVLFFILSLGEGLRLPGFTEPVIPLPFLLWRKIPFLGIIRSSLYFWFIVQVCVAVVAAHGVKKLWEAMDAWHTAKFPALRPIIGTGLLFLMLVEVVQAPLSPMPLRIHPVYEQIQRSGTGGAILDAPIRYTVDEVPYYAGQTMYLQTLYNHPLTGGYSMFDTTGRLEALAQHPLLAFFRDRTTTGVENLPDGEEFRTFLAMHQISWIILRKQVGDLVYDQRQPGWSVPKFLNLLAPALVNEEVQAVWKKSSRYDGTWDAARVRKADALVRRMLGPPVWDDAELVAYRVR